MSGGKSILTALAIALGSFPFSASAQPIFPLNTELPTTVLTVCSDRAASLEQAELSKRLGLEPFSGQRLLEALSRLCARMNVSVTPYRTESTIAPYITWATTYVPGSEKTFQLTYRGKTYTIPYGVTLQTMMFYEADVYNPKSNNRYSAWVEIPDRPFLLEYFRGNP